MLPDLIAIDALVHSRLLHATAKVSSSFIPIGSSTLARFIELNDFVAASMKTTFT